ncbi:MAG TPA: hypothetical protein VFW52_02280 [Candidatus Saccharimonadales bacterium]|nr:hypothetical protein [Candidatus Saccharimonadales bacterium]
MSPEKTIPDRCAECPVAKVITGADFEKLIEDCLGPKVVQLTCETVKVCDSPYKKGK